MKHLITVCIIVLWAYAYPSLSRMLDESSVVKAHQEWMIKYGITYTNTSEMEKRFQIFKEKLEYIEKFNNAGNKSYTVGLNRFSDLTTEEFMASYTGFKVSNQISSSKARSNPVIFNITDDVPAKVDWRESGAVTEVKNQGKCESCWAFSAVAAVEGFWKIKMGTLLTLSVQQLIDCDWSSEGCVSGDFLTAFHSIIRSDGILEESQYPYKEVKGTCRDVNIDDTEAYLTCANLLQANNEQNLQRVVATQPVAAGIAAGDDFDKYTGGVYSGPCAAGINHAVTIVGYGTTEDGSKYWLLKNSWGKDWGENGYMRIKREGGAPEGHCRIAYDVAIPCIN